MDLAELFAEKDGIFFGTAPRGITVGEVEELTAEDIVQLETEPRNSTPQPLVKLRGTHHALAKLLASGVKNCEAALALGLSESRVSILKNDPAFANLMEHYRGIDEIAFSHMRDKLAAVGMDTLEVLHERVLDEPEKIATELLIKLVEVTADRTGHGKSINVNSKTLTITAADMERLQSNEKVTKIAQEDRVALIRQISSNSTSIYPSSEEPSGEESCGNGVREESCGNVEEIEPRGSKLPQMDRIF